MTHLDNRKQLKVSDFTQYQNHGAYGGTVSYSNGSVIGFQTHFNSNKPSVRLFYNCNGRDYDYRVYWASVPSNLGRGEILYFICPVSGKKCRKLFFVDGMYVHRQAYPGQLYEQQADSKKWRGLTAIIPREEAALKKLKIDTIRIMYNGRPTKRYLRFIKTRQRFQKRFEQLYSGSIDWFV